ncbi:glycine betaine ABC transporter substrate-binding protein [Lentibacillus halophilus]|uniref:Glycine betaine ABC transporter substrate-binding protein n=1 Tax=Lentibacillus halophilus TaxID=295065 RepID=A0ABP3J244_9BACI
MSFLKRSLLIITTMVLLVLAACSESDSSGETNGSNEASAEDKDTIVIGQINWPENIAVTNMWKAILEDKGYDVNLKLMEMGPQMASISDGDLDIAPEVWLPVQDKSYYEEYKDEANFEDEPWYRKGIVGLAVPEYMEDINSIEDLNANKGKFDSEITGFEPGAGTMKKTKDVINDYDLDYNLIESSEAAMIATIQEKVENEEPVVAPLWKPHDIFSKVDLKFLDDPQKTYGETEKIYMASRDGFQSDYEDVYQWMSNWELTDDELGDLMVSVQEHEDNPVKGAKKWIDNNQDVVDEWME